MKIIDSTQNPEIKSIVKLQNKDERDRTGLFLAQGKRIIETLLESKLKLKQIYLTQELLENLLNNSENSSNSLNNLAPKSFIKNYNSLLNEKLITIVSEKVSEKINFSKSSSGIVAVFYQPEQKQICDITSGLVLAQINDPGNAGTLIRTAAALNIKTIITIDSVDLWNPKVIQASAGTIGLVNIYKLTWQELLKAKKDLQLVGLIVSNGQDIKSISKNRSLIVIGNEASGLPIECQNNCDMLVTLPMPGNTESLNAAVAGSIVLYLSNFN